jgi:hypothetical protein
MNAVLFGLNGKGRVVHTEAQEGCAVGKLHALAAARLARFDTVEIWIESVRVVTVSRSPACVQQGLDRVA